MAPRTHGTGPRHSGDKPAHRGKRKIDRKHICQLGRQHLALLPGPDSKSLHELQRNANRKPGMYQIFRALLSPSKVADGKAAEKASVSARFISHLGLQIFRTLKLAHFLHAFGQEDKPLDVLNVGRVENLSQENTDGNSSLKLLHTLWILGNDQ